MKSNSQQLPKQLALAMSAYNAFYDQQPQVFFDDLAHDYQMRWVRAARAIIEENRAYRGPGNPGKLSIPPLNKKQIAKARKAAFGTKSDRKTLSNIQFHKAAETMDPQLFLDTHVPKSKTGNRFQWGQLPNVRQRKVAKRIYWNLKDRERKNNAGGALHS